MYLFLHIHGVYWLTWLVIISSKMGVALSRQVARPYISNGYKASSGDYSFQGVISIDGEVFCSGTVITENLVLTAAHCLMDSYTDNVYPPQLVQFHIGKILIDTEAFNKLKSATHTILTKQVYPHRDFAFKDGFNDIGLVLLASNLDLNATHSMVTQVALYGSDIAVTGRLCQVAGWGLISAEPYRMHPRTLREATFRVKKPTTCQRHYSLTYDHRIMFCAAGAKNRDNLQPGTLQGDLGSPLICPAVKHSRFRKAFTAQLGIVFYGVDGDQASNNVSHTYFIRVPSFIQWIKSYVNLYSSSKLNLVYPTVHD